MSEPTVHELKVIPPYFDALVAGSKTFEIRKNDRGFQRGDIVKLREWHTSGTRGVHCCSGPLFAAHWAEPKEYVERLVTHVFSGDPRFDGLAPGYVVLSLSRRAPAHEALFAPSTAGERE